MKLVLMRHGEAESGTDDRARQLTEVGRRDVERMGRLLHATGWHFTEIRTSPVLRARQTGEYLIQSLRAQDNSATHADLQRAEDGRLAPGVDLEQCAEILAANAPNQVAVWVFHAPDVMHVAAYLLGCRESALYFTPGSMLALNLPLPRPMGRAMLVWQTQPEYFRELF